MRNFIKFTGLVFILLLVVSQSCKKKPTPPIVITTEVSSITQTSATTGGNVTSDGGEEIVVAGVCWSTSPNTSVKDKHTNDAKSLGSFTSNLTGLTPNTKYYIKAYAYNKAGTGYGNEVSFTTSPIALATITTTDITSITLNSAVSGGNITADGGDAITDRGVCWSKSQNPTITDSKTTDGNGAGSFASSITGLDAGTTYYVRAYAINSAGTSYGNELSFTTLGQAPTAITQAACCITTTGATLNGSVNANYLSTTVTFDYGTTTAYGSSVTASESPVTGNNSTWVSADLSGLNSGTTYHFRVKAVNSLGTTYGNDMEFITLITDIDGNIYQSVTIGNQVWMAENLKVTKYNNGNPIPNVCIPEVWCDLSSGAYCNYDKNPDLVNIYGRLYNWFAVNDSREICPAGWHIPSDNEWKTLEIFIGMTQEQVDLSAMERGTIEGGKLKETGTAHWNSPNLGATDEFGFTALPGGCRDVYSGGTFKDIGNHGYWWSATEISSTNALYRAVHYNSSSILKNDFDKNSGFSVRCLKD